MTGLGALIGLGAWLVILGLRGQQLMGFGLSRSGLVRSGQAQPDRASPGGASAFRLGGGVGLAWSLAALLVGVVLFVMTGWWVAAIGLAVLVSRIPVLTGTRNDHVRQLARTEAVASWTEMIRDNMAGAAGLEQALQVSAELAPRAITVELAAFARRVERRPLDEALIALGDDLDTPAADLVIAALVNSARVEARDLGPLLSRLAASTRADVRMRHRVEVGRARIRTSARIVVGATATTMVLLAVFSRELLAVYDTMIGQLWMLVVASVFAFGGWLLGYYARLDAPVGFRARRTRVSPGSGAA